MDTTAKKRAMDILVLALQDDESPSLVTDKIEDDATTAAVAASQVDE